MVPAVLFFGPVLAVLYNVIMGQGEVAKEIFLMYWHIMATGALFYIFSEICRGISNWHSERAINRAKRANPGLRHDKQKKTFSFEKVKDLADIKKGRYSTITTDSQFPRKAKTNRVLHEKLGPGIGYLDINCLGIGQVVDVFDIIESNGGKWARVTKWHHRSVYTNRYDDTHGIWVANGEVARWINMEDLDWVDDVDGIGTLYIGIDKSKWKDIGTIHSIHIANHEKGDA
jgi:hypothetical protein